MIYILLIFIGAIIWAHLHDRKMTKKSEKWSEAKAKEVLAAFEKEKLKPKCKVRMILNNDEVIYSQEFEPEALPYGSATFGPDIMTSRQIAERYIESISIYNNNVRIKDSFYPSKVIRKFTIDEGRE